MHTVKVADIEARIMDDAEKNSVLGRLRSHMEERLSRLPVRIDYGGSRIPTPSVFYNAQILTSQIDQHPLQKNIDLITGYVHLIDKLIDIDPAFFELNNLNGKNMIAALYTPEEFCINNREKDGKTPLVSLTDLEHLFSASPDARKTIEKTVKFPVQRDVSLDNLREYVNSGHTKAREYIRKSLEGLSAFRDLLGADVADFYSGDIGAWIALSYRRESAFIVRSSPTDKFQEAVEKAHINVLNYRTIASMAKKFELAKDDNARLSATMSSIASNAGEKVIQDPFILNMAAMGTYQRIFKECTFADEENLAEKLVNYANCFKLHKKVPEFQAKAVEWLKYAISILGNKPIIVTNLKYFTE